MVFGIFPGGRPPAKAGPGRAAGPGLASRAARFSLIGVPVLWVLLFSLISSAEAICKPGLVRRDGRFIPVSWNRTFRPIPVAAPPRKLLLRYLEHSSFLITGPLGGRILTDPYWTPVLNPLPDAVTVSNFHETHSQTGPYEKKTQIFFGVTPEGKLNTVDKMIRGIRVFSFPQAAENTNPSFVVNTIFIFKAGNVCIAHMGNARFGPSEGQIRALGKIHVLLLPIDGWNNISHEVGAKLVKRIGPNIVIPMHFAGPELSAQFANALKVEGITRVRWAKSPDLDLSLKRLPPPTVFTVLPPAENVP